MASLLGEPFGSVQGELFTHYGPPPETPEQQGARLTARARVRMDGLLAQARAADAMPWTEAEAIENEVLFRRSANWLAPAERDAACTAFAAELARLRATN